VAKADADAGCYQDALHVSVDNQNCYCSIDDCAVLEDSYAAMKTYHEVGIRGNDQLTLLGTRYNNFCDAASDCANGDVCVDGACEAPPCKDDPKWAKTTSRNRVLRCSWVAGNTSNRCSKVGDDGRTARKGCPKTCGKC